MVEHSAVGHKVLFNRECESHKAKVNRNVEGSSPSSGANLFGVSRLTMLKKDMLIASDVVVESEWVDLQQDI